MMQQAMTTPDDIRRMVLSPSANNLTLVKLGIAMMILFTHFVKLSGLDIEVPSLLVRRISLFYTISGLLAFNTLSRNSGRGFMLRRMRRLYPPYFTVVISCAIVFYTISEYGGGGYFLSAQFWKYLGANLTFMNFIEPDLPGVFTDSSLRFSTVNGALWSMKNTVLLLLTAPLVSGIIAGVARRGHGPGLVIIPIIVISLTFRAVLYLWCDTPDGPEWYDLERTPPCQLCYFYTGALVYFYFDRFKRNLPAIAVVAAGLMLAKDFIPMYLAVAVPVVESMVILCAAFAIGRSLLPRSLPDITYLIFLFHWPVIQVVLLAGLPHRAALLVTVAIVIALSLAYATVERRILHVNTCKTYG